mgnify:CR=1 FL=1
MLHISCLTIFELDGLHKKSQLALPCPYHIQKNSFNAFPQYVILSFKEQHKVKFHWFSWTLKGNDANTDSFIF